MTTAFLFPGQGSQFVGMGRDLYDGHAAARKVFDEANEVLGFDLAHLCFEGPEDELRETRNTQPAIFVHSAAVLAALDWNVGGNDCAAGHSLGEYSAYYAAGALSFADALRLVRKRGELMWDSGKEKPGAMAAILGLGAEPLSEVLERILGVVVPANLNSPTQIVISGEVGAVEEAMEALKDAGAKRVVRLEVSGAFHSPLLESAAVGLREALASAEVRKPRAAVFANESARPVTDPSEIRTSLEKQLLSPVRWEETIRNMIDSGVTRFVEVGPGKVLCGLVRAVDKSLDFEAVGTLEQIEARLNAAEEPR